MAITLNVYIWQKLIVLSHITRYSHAQLAAPVPNCSPFNKVKSIILNQLLFILQVGRKALMTSYKSYLPLYTRGQV